MFKNGKFNGEGIIFNKNNVVKYKGKFENNEPNKCSIF
jgi:hypothetical protein